MLKHRFLPTHLGLLLILGCSVDSSPPQSDDPPGMPGGDDEADDHAGTQVGDDGTGVSDPGPCISGWSPVAEPDVALNGQEWSPAEWLEVVAGTQQSQVNLEYRFSSGEICELEAQLELSVESSTAEVWWSYDGELASQGTCVAPQFYEAGDVRLVVRLHDILSVEVGVSAHSPSSRTGGLDTLTHKHLPWKRNQRSLYEVREQELWNLCKESGDLALPYDRCSSGECEGTAGAGGAEAMEPDLETIQKSGKSERIELERSEGLWTGTIRIDTIELTVASP